MASKHVASRLIWNSRKWRRHPHDSRVDQSTWHRWYVEWYPHQPSAFKVIAYALVEQLE